MLRLFSVSLVTVAVLTPVAGRAQAIRGGTLFEQHCTACHGNPALDSRAPDRETLRQFTPERVLAALTSGAMAVTVPGLTDEEKRQVAEWATGRTLGAEAGNASAMPNPCPSKPLGDPFAGAVWNGWSPDVGNSRFQPAAAAGLTPDQVPHLRLKWAFGFPGGASAASGSPAVAGGRLFVGADTGFVYSLDAASGCVYWSFEAQGGVRSAISVGPITGAGTARYAAYFGDVKANVYAVNAESGELLWMQQAESHPIARITGAPKLHAGRLYVPVSSLEEAAGANLWYECCKFRGSVVAYDANTGEQIWKSYAIAEEPKPTTKNSEGTQQWGPAGAAVWNSPTIDAKRGALYIGTGNAYTAPAADDSDAVVAFDLDTGKRLWWHQLTSDDAFLLSCNYNDDSAERSENCPEPGPIIDVDVEAVMLHTLADGRTILVVGEQGGRVFALDPDREGAVLWELSPGAEEEVRGSITFGGASDGRLAYFPIAFRAPAGEPTDPTPPPQTGGLAAIRVGTGELVWFTPTPAANCPDPSPLRCSAGQKGAATVIPGVVFSGSEDGMLRANSTTDGRIIWEYNTAQEFETVNRVPARGGTLNGPGPTIAGGMLFMGSGYTIALALPGNVLLAFGVD